MLLDVMSVLRLQNVSVDLCMLSRHQNITACFLMIFVVVLTARYERMFSLLKRKMTII